MLGLFHDVQQQNLLLRRHPGGSFGIGRRWLERAVKCLCRIPEHIPVRCIFRRHGRNRSRQILEDFRKQRIVEMHPDGLALVGAAGAVQAQRDTGLIEMGVETRRVLEGSDIELVRIFERDFGFVRDGSRLRLTPSWPMAARP
jgi:hypothetical protein